MLLAQSVRMNGQLAAQAPAVLVPPNRLPPEAPIAGADDVVPNGELEPLPKSEPVPVADPKPEAVDAAPNAGADVAEKLNAGVLESAAAPPAPNMILRKLLAQCKGVLEILWLRWQDVASAAPAQRMT